MGPTLHRFTATFLPEKTAGGSVLPHTPASPTAPGASAPATADAHAGGAMIEWLRHHHLMPAGDVDADPAREAQRARSFERAAGRRYY